MRLHGCLAMSLVTLLANDAGAQLQAVLPPAGKAGFTSTASAGAGGFLGSDACTSAHTPAGSGDVFGVPFVTGTTGTQGQNEASCYFSGTTGIDGDVWYDWSATATGNATATTCGGTSVDTKIAVWPIDAACPADGTSLACSDDACSAQSSATWPVTSGTSYTIQVGTFPGASGGSGTFDVFQSPPFPCGTYDDGTSENALGLTAGGETGWLHGQDCLTSVDSVETAYGSPIGGAPPNGNDSRIVCYEDADCDGDPTTPAMGMTLVWSVTTVTVNSGTDLLNTIPAPTPSLYIASGCSFVMATADQAAGEFPAPLDQTHPTPQAWVVGNTPGAGSLDVTNLNNNSVAPLQIGTSGFPGAWLLRTSQDCMTACNQCQIPPCPGPTKTPCGPCAICRNWPCNLSTPTCLGDGTGGTCGCGNNGGANEGCANSTGSGAQILGLGIPSLSNDTFELVTTQIPNTPGLTFQGNSLLGSPPTFGDGIRCCGQGVVRWITILAVGNCASTNQPAGCGNQVGGIGGPISQHPGNASLSPGDSRCYQHWYRDPGAGNPCQVNFFNLSPAIVVLWQA